MEFRIEGKLAQKFAAASGESNGREWKRQDFLVEYVDGQYTRNVVFSAWTNSVPILDQFQIGEPIVVTFSIEATQSKMGDRWFNSLRAFRLERPGQMQQGMPYGQPMQQPYGQPMQQPYQQPMQQPYQQPMQQPYQQPYGQPMQQPYQQPMQQPTEPQNGGAPAGYNENNSLTTDDLPF